ncbi:MAG: flagellar biosynthesis anti-sigma factor FlgM [Desulfobia sp.]
MKINADTQIAALYKSKKANQIRSVEQTEAVHGPDKVQISKSAQQAEGTTRTERIQELKAQVENGTYNPDMRKVASGLIQFLTQGK